MDPMTPLDALDLFSGKVLRKASETVRSHTSSVQVDDFDLYPQAWRVRGSGGTDYSVVLTCTPRLRGEYVVGWAILGARCTCPNGRNTPLGSPRCYHVAAVLMKLAWSS